MKVANRGPREPEEGRGCRIKRTVELKEEKDLSLPILLPEVQRIANEAKEDPNRVFTNLAHLLDESVLYEAFWRLRKGGAAGVDRVTWRMYEVGLAENISDLHQRLKEQRYKAQAVRRVYIDKEDGRKRPLGIPAQEDKLVQKAVVMVLEPIYENDFFSFSYGFRPRKSAYQALHALREQGMGCHLNWIIDADIEGFFDQLDHRKLIELLRHRVKDGGIERLIGKWLKAGIQDGCELLHPERGTPQGGVISPLLANIYLHYVLDEWFEREVKPRMRGEVWLVRYADDFVIGCEREEDARRLLEVLPKRLSKYALKLHPEKTRLVRFHRQSKGARMDQGNGVFDFLGFTHYWGKSKRGYWVIKRRTISKRQRRVLKELWNWCKSHRHQPIREQYATLRRKLRGLYQYYGIRGNSAAIRAMYGEVVRTWRYWLGRRSQKSAIRWEKLMKMLKLLPLPEPRIVHWSI